MDDFLQKLKKVVPIVLYGHAISQSDCRKAGPYQLPIIMCNKDASDGRRLKIPTKMVLELDASPKHWQTDKF